MIWILWLAEKCENAPRGNDAGSDDNDDDDEQCVMLIVDLSLS